MVTTTRQAITRPLAIPTNGHAAQDLSAALLLNGTFRRGVRPTGDPVRLLLVDDQHLVRHALKALLLKDPRFLLVGDAASADDCARMATQSAAQVVLLSGTMRDGESLKVLQTLAAQLGAAHAIVLGDEDNTEFILDAFRAGAYGFLPRTVSLSELHDAVEAVAAGGTYVLPSTAKILASGLRTPAPARTGGAARQLVEQLSAREQSVFLLVARGFSGPEIAAQLGITVKTVDTYRHRICEKIGIQHRSDYVKTSLEAGLLVR